MIKPVFTEKSLKLAKEGKYTFFVEKNSDKNSLKSRIAKLFGVHVTGIKTINYGGENRRNVRGVKLTILPKKKAIVTLKEGEKIDIFEESKK